jgi:hypothetical protein
MRFNYRPSRDKPPLRALCMPILFLLPVGFRARDLFALEFPGGAGVYLHISGLAPLPGRGHRGNIGQEDAEQANTGSEVHGFTRAGRTRHNAGVRSAGILALVCGRKEVCDA